LTRFCEASRNGDSRCPRPPPNAAARRCRWAPHKPEPYSGPSKAEVLALRKQYLSPGLITYYQDPLLIVEGKMQYLWDETASNTWTRLPASSPVSVGHCHRMSSTRSANRSAGLQHVTTIYLHPTIGQLGKKLAEKMPAGSKLTNSYFTKLRQRGETRSRSCRAASTRRT